MHADLANDLRWHATVTYRSAQGPTTVEHRFQELEDLHDLVERGPDWNAIMSITVTLARPTSPALTLEEAEGQ